jgi:signal peptidase II
MHGKVVDMFYFPLWNGTLPNWLPIWGGQDAEFFRFIFNFADASISVAMFFIVTRYLLGKKKQ